MQTPSVLGNNLFDALFVLGLGATGGLAGGALAAGAGGLGSTLGSLGTLAGTAGSLGNLVAPAVDAEWFSRLTQGLGAAGGIAGGVGGLTNLWSTGINSLGDAARLASNAGRVTGGLGTLSDSDVLRQAGGYLGAAGQLGGGVDTLSNVLGGGVKDLTDAARLASGVGQVAGAAGRVTGNRPLQQAAGLLGLGGRWVATCRACSGQRTRRSSAAYRHPQPGPPHHGRCRLAALDGTTRPVAGACGATIRPLEPLGREWSMAEWWEWTGEPGPWQANEAPDLWAGGSPTFNEGGSDYFQSPAYQQFTGWGTLWPWREWRHQRWGQLALQSPQWRRPGACRSLWPGGCGRAAALDARLHWRGRHREQRGQRGGTAPGGGVEPWDRSSNSPMVATATELIALSSGWAGGLAQLQQLAGREQPSMASSYPTQVNRQWYDYGIPSATPGWQPETYQGPQGPNAGDYRWTPQQGPQAADYRYTPGQIPAASHYAYRPGAVPTLSGQELLANDPGVAFRLAEGRKALEGSAAARGGLLSGPTLAALQRSGQELSSQEYSNAWNRASQQAQLREQWGQAASQMGWQQAEAESRLREQVNQIASQQGWNQSQAEAAFREGQAQLASQQGWNQALQGQQNQFTQGLDTSKWNTLQQQQWAQEQYKNMMEQNQRMYSRDFTENQSNYEREQARYRQQLAQHLLPFEQQSTLANLGGQAVGMYGQQGQAATSGIARLLEALGGAQGTGAAGQGLAWTRALGGATNQLPSLLAGLNA